MWQCTILAAMPAGVTAVVLWGFPQVCRPAEGPSDSPTARPERLYRQGACPMRGLDDIALGLCCTRTSSRSHVHVRAPARPSATYGFCTPDGGGIRNYSW